MRRRVQLAVLFMPLFFLVLAAGAAEKKFHPTTPASNQGVPWRIGYLEGGPYVNYPVNLRALVMALAEMGWMEPLKLPPQADETDTRQLWAWLSHNVKSSFIRFVPDAYWSNDWDDARRKTVKDEVLRRLTREKDIDLMLAMGTRAGQDLANSDHHVATIVMSSSNPLESNIIKSYQDSGLDHLNARVDPTRYERQVRIFHDIFGFKKLGIVYETDTPEGRTYGAIEDVKRVSRERGFEVVACHAPFSNVSPEEAKKAVRDCIEGLAPKIDAFYFTTHRGVTDANMERLLAPLYARRIPTFSQMGSHEVKYGVLLSIARAGFKYIGRFHAETIARIFNGAKPRDLEQIFEDPPRIAINLKAAQIIGYDPELDILGSADEVYDTIATVKKTGAE
ncbi:MAG: ABC transporter substrate-binding protein [Thermodesulfobacteriota bacterium]